MVYFVPFYELFSSLLKLINRLLINSVFVIKCYLLKDGRLIFEPQKKKCSRFVFWICKNLIPINSYYLYFFFFHSFSAFQWKVYHLNHTKRPPSSRGQGHLLFTEETGIRIPLGVINRSWRKSNFKLMHGFSILILNTTYIFLVICFFFFIKTRFLLFCTINILFVKDK